MTLAEFLALDVPARAAVLVAVRVRNGVEEIHADGAITDEQMPTFNRLVRQELFQACVSDQIGTDAHTDYLVELSDDGAAEAGDDFRLLCLSGAAVRAVRTFAEAERLNEATTLKLAEAAQAAVRDTHEAEALLTPVGGHFLVSYISPWETPKLSVEYSTEFGLV